MSNKADAEFKRFHKMLCDRVGYVHDELHWKRDQLSLIEFIANKDQPAVDPHRQESNKNTSEV